MPIKPENRARYPKDWPAISRAAKERAGWKCQHAGCRAQQYAVGRWIDAGNGFSFQPLAERGDTFSQAKQNAADVSFSLYGDDPVAPKIIVIVLTVAHLNHQPEDCRPENLAAMCQRHHLAYDHAHHIANAWATRRARSGTLELF